MGGGGTNVLRGVNMRKAQKIFLKQKNDTQLGGGRFSTGGGGFLYPPVERWGGGNITDPLYK